MSLTRREWLGGILALLAAASGGRSAHAIGAATRFRLCTLSLPGAEVFPRPGVIEAWLYELSRNTSVEVDPLVKVVALTDSTLFDYPLVIVAGTRGFPPLGDREREALALFFRAGGMLFADDCSGLNDGEFSRCLARELATIFPGQELATLDRGHAVYRTFFLLQRSAGRVVVRPYLEGITLGEVTPVILSRNDLLGAWSQDSAGGYLYETVPGGREQRLIAYKMGINVMMYALTLNYKLDATHVRALLKKRRGVYDE